MYVTWGTRVLVVLMLVAIALPPSVGGTVSPIELYPGDILAFEALGYRKVLNHIVEPSSDRWHFVLLYEYLEEKNDWTIYESLYGKGVKISMLRKYDGEDVKVYRVSEDGGKEAVKNVVSYTHSGYDYRIRVALFGDLLEFWVHNGIKKIPYTELHDRPNGNLLCTEIITAAYNEYIRLVPEGIAVTPAALEQAHIEGKMELIFEGSMSLQCFRKKT